LAAQDLIMTSRGNRAVRIVLGSVYLYAAATLAHRWMDASMLAKLLGLDAAAIGKASLVWGGCVVNGYFAGVWLTEAANGECRLRCYGTNPQWNPDGVKWRPMPRDLVNDMKAKSKRNQIFRRWWFWSLTAAVLVGWTVVRASIVYF
jgi:hypothetical protein